MTKNLNAVVNPQTTMSTNTQGLNLALFNPDGSPFTAGGGVDQEDLDGKQDASEFLEALVTLGPAPDEGSYQLLSINGSLQWYEIEIPSP